MSYQERPYYDYLHNLPFTTPIPLNLDSWKVNPRVNELADNLVKVDVPKGLGELANQWVIVGCIEPPSLTRPCDA